MPWANCRKKFISRDMSEQRKRSRPGYLTQYARHAGISVASASEALKRVGIDYLEPFDFAEADRRRRAARHADRVPLSKPIYGQYSQIDDDTDEALDPSTESNQHHAKPGSFSEEQTRQRHFLARLSELDYLERIGKLVRKDKVEEAAFRKWRIARDRMENMVERIAADLAAETDHMKVREKLFKEVHQAMEELASGKNPDNMDPDIKLA